MTPGSLGYQPPGMRYNLSRDKSWSSVCEVVRFALALIFGVMGITIPSFRLSAGRKPGSERRPGFAGRQPECFGGIRASAPQCASESTRIPRSLCLYQGFSLGYSSFSGCGRCQIPEHAGRKQAFADAERGFGGGDLGFERAGPDSGGSYHGFDLLQALNGGGAGSFLLCSFEVRDCRLLGFGGLLQVYYDRAICLTRFGGEFV
ncbi:hypothetical protein KC19_1G232200 [Ceratodon purpureus]|uniref:Uncharacterized protein n=1 Tax=Ceratodon purpureus TaxID=3225 RepID=A0A8T0JBH1_CERPU|nr:hypothetical protein KC19_1G232200 [Ceratodon purpureus]